MGKTRKQALNRFADVVGLNAFVAARPERARTVFKASGLTGLWQLDLVSGRDLWSVGHYVEGLEDAAVEHDVGMRLSWGGYVVEGPDGWPRCVLWLEDGLINVALPHEYDVAITAPQVCGNGNPLFEPVYIWRDAEGRYRVLECAGGLYGFGTIRELEEWVRGASCPERHERPTIHWTEWYVIRGTVGNNEDWDAAIRRAEPGRYNPSPNEVIELTRKLL
jgi:hypothetical protein